MTLWEIFTCGRVPYTRIHAMCLLTELKRGETLEKPDNKACHDDMLVFSSLKGSLSQVMPSYLSAAKPMGIGKCAICKLGSRK